MAGALTDVASNYGVQLSSAAQEVHALTLRAFLDEFTFRDGRQTSVSEAGILAEVVGAAAQDPAVLEVQAHTGRVDYFTWFSALGRHGQRIFRTIMDKGF
jgi:hypothetical protein